MPLLTGQLNNLASSFDNLLRKLTQPASNIVLAKILIPVMIFILWPLSWFTNEENYLFLAYSRMTSEHISEYSSAIDRSSVRFLFEWIIGNLVVAVGYDIAHALARIIMAFLYAGGLAILFAALRLSILDAVGSIAVFWLVGQELMADMHMFRSVEYKTLAYAAVISALGLGFYGCWVWVFFMAVLATYFHFQVGGFWALALAVLYWLRGHSILEALKMIAYYIILVAPIVVLLAYDHFGNPAQPAAGELNPDIIYALRHPHHVMPFSSLSQMAQWSHGFVVAGALLLAFVMMARRIEDSSLPLFVAILLGYLFLALAVAFFDQNTHIFAKFYLFRPSDLILFLSIVVFLFIWRGLETEEGAYLRALGLIVVISLFLWMQVVTAISQTIRTIKNYDLADQVALLDAIERESAPGEIVLIQPRDNPMQELARPDVALPRLIPRPTLVSYKGIPTNPADILRWHRRLNFRSRVFNEGCEQPLEYPVRLLIVFDKAVLERVQNCGRIIWQGSEIVLVGVDT